MFKMKKSCLFFLVAIVLQHSAAGQVMFGSLEEILDYAGSHSVNIQASLIQQEISQTNLKQSKGSLYPSINTTGGFTDYLTIQPTLVPAQIFNPKAEEGTFEELTFGKKYNYSLGLQSQWDVLNFQKIFTAKTASIQVKMSKSITQQTKYNTYKQLASSYYAILLNQKASDIYKENLSTAQVIVSSAKKKYQQGIISKDAFNKATIQEIQAKRNLMLVQSNLEQLILQLQSMLIITEPLTISDDLENYLNYETSSDFSVTHPDLKVQEMQLLFSEMQLKQSKHLKYPTISLAYQYNRLWATDDFFNFSQANDLPQQFISLKITRTIFQGFTIRNKVKTSKWELKLQQLQLDNMRIAKQKEDEILQLQQKQSIKDLKKAQSILELQEESDKHIENKFQKGIISLDERLDKYQELLTIQNDYLQSLSDYSVTQFQVYLRQKNYE